MMYCVCLSSLYFLTEISRNAAGHGRGEVECFIFFLILYSKLFFLTPLLRNCCFLGVPPISLTQHPVILTGHGRGEG